MLGAAASLQGGPSVLHLRGASWPGYGISFQVEGCPDILAALWKLRGCPVSLVEQDVASLRSWKQADRERKARRDYRVWGG